MNDRHNIAADLEQFGLWRVLETNIITDLAEHLIALGWTRLDPATVAVLQKALLIGSISYDGDGWFARDAGYDYDDAEATLTAARRIVESLAKAYREDTDA